MKIYSQNIKPIRFTSNTEQEPGKVEYSNEYFLKQEREALKAHMEEHFRFDEFILDNISTKRPKKQNNILSVIGKIQKNIKK